MFHLHIPLAKLSVWAFQTTDDRHGRTCDEQWFLDPSYTIALRANNRLTMNTNIWIGHLLHTPSPSAGPESEVFSLLDKLFATFSNHCVSSQTSWNSLPYLFQTRSFRKKRSEVLTRAGSGRKTQLNMHIKTHVLVFWHEVWRMANDPKLFKLSNQQKH